MKSKYICHTILFLWLTFNFNFCIEPFNPELNQSDLHYQLVVEGQLTDETGPFKVHLTKSGPVDKVYSQEPYLGADVMIIDDDGNKYQLIDNNNGWYETEDKYLKGIPGLTYILKITDAEGNNFESTPQLLSLVPDIDSVYFNEVKQTRFENNNTYVENWLNILLDSHDQEEKTKYWQWKFEETWEIKMSTYVHVMHGEVESPDKYFSYETVDIDPEKVVCWVAKPSQSVLIHSTISNSKDDIKGFVVQSLGPGEDKLHIRYSILIKQYSLNKVMYNFWKQLQNLNETTGTIFSTIPSSIYGNIVSVDGSNKALGYFSASSVKTKRIFINPADHHISTVSPYDNCLYLTDPNPIIFFRWIYFATIVNSGIKLWTYDSNSCTDCRYYGTNVKPDFW